MGSRLRWVVLGTLCIVIYSFVYCYDNPLAIQNQLQEEYGLSILQYNMLYSIYSYPNVIFPLLSGMIIDYVGVNNASLIFYSLILVGQSIWTLACLGNGSYTFMLIGRGLFGSGAEAFHTVRKIFMVDYFLGAEFSFASGFSLSFSRIATGTQSIISAEVYEEYGIFIVLAVGWVLVFISMQLLMIFVCYQKHSRNKKKSSVTEKNVKKYLIKQNIASPISGLLESNEESLPSILDIEQDMIIEEKSNNLEIEKGKIYLSAVFTNKLEKRYWMLGILLCSFYSSFISFNTIGSSFLQSKYNYSYKTGNTLITIPYFMATVLTPIFGYICDRIGHRCQLLLISSICILLGHLFLSFSSLIINIASQQQIIQYILVCFGLSCLGMGYSIFGSILWPSFALIVERKYLATGIGLFGSLDNALQATSFVIIGASAKDYKKGEQHTDEYEYATYYWLFLSVNNIFWVLLLWFYDKHHFNNIFVLNEREAKAKFDAEIKYKNKIDVKDDISSSDLQSELSITDDNEEGFRSSIALTNSDFV